MDAYGTILRLTDDAVPHIMDAQKKDPNCRDYEGQISPGKGFAEPSQSAYAAAVLISAYLCDKSRWHGNEGLLDAAISSLKFLNRMCHEDGTLDLVETNFFDATVNGFAVQVLAYTYRLLEQNAKTEKELEAECLVRSFIEKSASAMLTGGFHTPNHRWVVASALSLCWKILDSEECLEMAQIYLSEGIDCNDEGDYTERSVGIYDAVNNGSLAIIAQELNKPELYEFIDRNLEKNWYYTEPDLTALTLASRRQDYGNEAQMVHHFYSYYLAAARTVNKNFMWMAARLLRQMENLQAHIGQPHDIAASINHQNLLTRFMLDTPHQLPCEEPMPIKYDKFFNTAGVARVRQGNWTCSLLKDNSTFMKLQNGNLKVYFKLACTFFQFGRLLAQEITPIENGYRMICEQEWGYVRPIKNLNEPDWHKIDRNIRDKANMQKHKWQVEIIIKENGLSLYIHTDGTPRIPIKLECILPPGGLAKTAGSSFEAQPGGWMIAGEAVTYYLGGEAIRFSGCFNKHDYTNNMRNSDPSPPGRFTIYCTGFTLINKLIEIDMI